MQQTTQLASAQVGHASITVALVAGTDGPAVIIKWPELPTATTPARFPELAATLTRLFANASTELARMKAGHKR